MSHCKVKKPATRMQLAALLAVLLSFHHAEGQITFQRDYGLETVSDYGNAVLHIPDGGYCATGTQDFPDSSFAGDGILLRINEIGDTVWRRTYAFPGTFGLGFKDLIATVDGGFVVTGYIDSGWVGTISGLSMFIGKVDALGEMLWSHSIGGNDAQTGYQIEETTDGGFIVAGYNAVTGMVNEGAYYLVRTNNVGDTLWTKTYDHLEHNLAYALAPMPDEGWVLVGTTQPSSTTLFHVIRTDQNGDTLWTRTLNELGSGQARDVETLPNGHIMITGWNTVSTGYARPVLIELDENGNLLWYRDYEQVAGGGIADWTKSLCKTTTGYALFGLDSNYDFSLINVDYEGDTLWTRRFAIGDGDYGYSVEQTSDGGFIMCGITYLGSIQIVLVKTDASGNVVTSTHDLALDPSVTATLFPNPVAGTSTFEYTTTGSGIYTLVLHDGRGRVVKVLFSNQAQAPGQHDLPIDLSGLASGAYTLVLSNGQRAVSVKAIKR